MTAKVESRNVETTRKMYAAVPGLAGAVRDRVAHGTSVAPGRRVRYLRRLPQTPA